MEQTINLAQYYLRKKILDNAFGFTFSANEDDDTHTASSLKSYIDTKVAKETGKGLSTNDYTTAEKNKLAGIANGATANTIDSALSSSSTNAVQNKVINTALGTKVDKEDGKGLSTNDYTTTEKNKLANIEEQANNYTHPSYTARTGKPTGNQTPAFGGTATVSQITSDASGHVTGATDRTIKIPNTEASTTASGLMSKDDKTKLDGISTGAKNVSVEAKGSGTIEIAQITVDGTTTSIKQRDNNTTYTAASATPNMDGTGAVGTSAKYAREDHIHPTDTSRASTEVTDDLQEQISNIVSGETSTNHDHDGVYIKTGTGTVTTTNIANGTIKNEDISTSAAIAQSKINNLTNDLVAKNVTLTKLSTPTNNTYIATYEIKQGETSIGKIDIPKDFLIQSASLEHCETANTPLEGLNVGDPYIHFVANTNDGTQTARTIDINVKDLVDTYKADNSTLQLNTSTNTFSIKSQGVTTTQIKNGTIINKNISSDAAISQSKIDGLITDLSGKSDNGHTHSQYLTSHQDISGKENTSNKTSSWNSTTNNTRYPTEKLVKDSLDGKINTSAIKNDLTSGGATNVLSAEQGKTLKSLIDASLPQLPNIADGGDLNDANTHGWCKVDYRDVNYTIGNLPSQITTAFYGILEIKKYTDNYIVQTLYKTKNGADIQIFFRKKAGGTWDTTWKEIADTDTYTAGTNLSLSGTQFNHTTSGVGAKSNGLYKTTIDAQGHITAATAVTIDTTAANNANNLITSQAVYNGLSGKAPTSHASTATTYGVATTANYGHAKIVQNLTTDDANGLALGAGQGKALKAAVDGKAPTSHASTATTYGAGNASNYGHVKLSDNYTSSAGAASASVGASSKAIADAYSALNTTVGEKAPTSHAVNATTYGLGTTGVYGHTKIVENLTTSAANGLALGAGQGKALKALVDNKLNIAQGTANSGKILKVNSDGNIICDNNYGIAIDIAGTVSKQYLRLFRITGSTPTTTVRPVELAFEIMDYKITNKFSTKINVIMRHAKSKTDLYIDVLECSNPEYLEKLYFCKYHDGVNPSYIDIFMEISQVLGAYVKPISHQSSYGTFTQYAPVQNGTESYTSIEVAGQTLSGNSNFTYTAIQNPNYTAVDTTIGGTKDSQKPISSDALYQTVNNPPSPSTWLKITALEKTSTRNYRQYLNYNPFTGIVQLYGSTPARIIDGNYSVVSYLVNEGTEITISETAGLDNVTITGEITDYAPKNDIHFVARGAGTYNNDSSTTMAFFTLQPDGKIFAKSITGGQLPKKIYDFNITYRCKLNYYDTQPS